MSVKHTIFGKQIQWCSCCSIFSIMCMFSRSLFVPLYFFFWPLCCMILFLITPLVSSKSSFFLLTATEYLYHFHLLYSQYGPFLNNDL